MPSRRRSMMYAAVLAAVLSVAACSGGDPAPTPSATSPVTAGTTTAPSTSPTGTPPATSTSTTAASPTPATPTSTGPAFPAGVPAAARQKDQSGANAFAAFFVQQVNASWTRPDSSIIEPLCDKTSKSCFGLVNVAKDLEAQRHHYDGAPVTAISFVDLSPEAGRTRVLLIGRQERRNIVDESGRVISTDAQEPTRTMFYLAWTATGWKVVDTRLVVS